MNLASIWKLPVIFVCENNGYAVSSPVQETTAAASEKIANLSLPFQIPGVQVDGQDVVAVYNAASAAADRARAGEGPSFIEAVTYRYSEHAIGLGRAMWSNYRTDEEMSRWRGRDPVVLFRERLAADGVVSDDEFIEMDNRIKADIAEAVEFARTSPYPAGEDLYADMYSG
jgi:pyruvate dehydrogenase E1 component alpha subunit